MKIFNKFTLFDAASAGLASLFGGAFAWWYVSYGENMFIAMVVGMFVPMLLVMPLALIFGRIWGALETMVAMMLAAMIAGMVVAMAKSMFKLDILDAVTLISVCALLSWVYIFLLNLKLKKGY